MQSFNTALALAIKGHQKRFGINPSPGLAWDLTRAIHRFGLSAAEEVAELFTPTSRARIRTSMAAQQVGLGERSSDVARELWSTIPPSSVAQLLVREAETSKDVRGFLDAMGVSIEAVRAGVGSMLDDEDEDTSIFTRLPDVSGPVGRNFPTRALAPSEGDFLSTFLGQIGGAVLDMPFGAYQMAKSVGLDLRDLVLHRDISPERSGALIAAMGEQILEDLRHPTDNPGYLFLDVLAIATAGAGAGARLGAATRATGVKATTRALIVRPPAGTFTLGYEGMTAQIPLSDSALIRNLIERPILQARQAKLEAQRLGAYERNSIPILGQVIDRSLSAQATIRRKRQITAELEFKLQTIPVRELERARRKIAHGHQTVLAAITGALRADFDKLPSVQKLAVEKAALVYSLADPDPLNTFVVAHNRAIDRLEIEASQTRNPTESKRIESQIAAHERHLAALELAAKYVSGTPPKRVAKFIEKVKEVSDYQARLKNQILGLDEEVMSNHLLEVAAHLRGEKITRVPTVAEGATPLIGMRVRAADRDNLGTIQTVDMDAGTADVLFFNQQTKERATVTLPLDQLTDSRRKPVSVQLDLVMPETRAVALDLEPFYLPFQKDIVGKRAGRKSLGAGSGEFGVPAPGLAPGTVRYRFTGEAFEHGDFRLDVSDLIAEQATQVARLGIQKAEHAALWSVSRETPAGIPKEYVRPIRDIRNVPDELRDAVALLEGRQVKRKDVRSAGLSDKKLDSLIKWLYPDADDVKPGEHVRYVDERFFRGRVDEATWRALDMGLSALMSAPNELGRIMYLFGRLAYGINALGSTALGLVHQGPLFFPNFTRAIAARHLYGERVQGVIQALAGTTKSQSYLTEANKLTTTSRFMGNTWAKITDNKMREAAVIYELRRKGLLRDEDSPVDIVARLESLDPEMRKTLAEVRDRANKWQVDFDDLTWVEKSVLRHLFFIYAWTSRSSLYGLHFLTEKPIQSDVLAQAGRERKEEIERLVGNVPEWFNRKGYIPIGRAFVLDPMQLNAVSTLNEVAYSLASLVTEVPFTQLLEDLSPAAQAYVDAVQTAFTEKGGSLTEAVVEFFTGSPLGSAFTRAEYEPTEIPPDPLVSGPMEVLEAAIRADMTGANDRLFEVDGFWSTWGPLIGGTAIPQRVDQHVANAKFLQELRRDNPVEFVGLQIQAAFEMITRQEELLGRKAPKEIRDWLRGPFAEIHVQEERKRDALGVDEKLGARDRLLITVQVLADRGYLTPQERTAIMSETREKSGRAALDRLRLRVLRDNGGEAWWAWNQEAGEVHKMAGVKLDVLLGTIDREGLGTYSLEGVPVGVRRAYARRWLKELNTYAALREAGDDAALRAWESRQHKDVVIDGVRLPSFAKVAWIDQTPGERQQALTSALRGYWSDLTPLEKELLGRATTPEIQKGWQALEKAKDAYLAANPTKTTLTAEQELAAVQAIETKFPGFAADWSFSKLPLAERFQASKLYQTSEFKTVWTEILAGAGVVNEVLAGSRSGRGKFAGYSITYTKNIWKTFVGDQLVPWVLSQSQAFQNEFAALGGQSFLEGLIER